MIKYRTYLTSEGIATDDELMLFKHKSKKKLTMLMNLHKTVQIQNFQ